MPSFRPALAAAAILAALLMPLYSPADPEKDPAKKADALVERFIAANKDVAAKRAVVEELRLMGAAGMEAIRRAMDANDKARGTAEAERKNVLICEAWTQTEMVPCEKGADWKEIRAERCFGGKPIVAPAGTKVVSMPAAVAPNYEGEDAMTEEYCVREGTEGATEVRHGPYVLRDRSGSAVEQGQYVDGLREGEWTTVSFTQVVVQSWKNGEQVKDSARVIGAPRWIVLDFSRIVKVSFLVPCRMGSTTVSSEASGDDEVVLRVGGEIEMGAKPTVVYRVPRSVGRRTFDNGSMGLELTGLEAYRQKK